MGLCLASTIFGVYFGINVFFAVNSNQTMMPVARLRTGGRAPFAPSAGLTQAARAARAAAQRTTAAPPPTPPGPDLLFVGVMTADQFLDSRAVAVYETWGQTVPGGLEFFTSETSGGPAGG